MEFLVDGKKFFELSPVKKKVICHDIYSSQVDEDITRRMVYIIEQKYKACMNRLKSEWIEKLRENGIKSIPIDDDELAELIFSQPNYKDREQRELEKQSTNND